MRKLFLSLGVLTLAGCATVETEAPKPMEPAAEGGMQMGSMMWSGDLAAQPGHQGASGAVQANSTPGGTSISIRFTGMAMKGMTHTHPWHIHAGTCGSGGAIVGDPAAYPPLQVGADGSATAAASISPALQMGQEYYVDVHESPQALGNIVACAQLAHGAM